MAAPNLAVRSQSYLEVTVWWGDVDNADYYEYDYVDADNPYGCANFAHYPWNRVDGTSVTLNAGQAITVCGRAIASDTDGFAGITGPHSEIDITPIGVG